MVSPEPPCPMETGLKLVVVLVVFASLAFSSCYPVGIMADWAHTYDLCVYVEGVTLDSLTREPLEGVRVETYYGNKIVYLDTTNGAGVYQSNKLERLFWSTPKELRELKSKPLLKRYLDLRMVFEKDDYRESELVIPVEFVYCSSHPNPVEIPVVRIPDVLLVPE
jgi:hypothetical protein